MFLLSAFFATLLTTLGVLAIPLIIWSFRGRQVCDQPYCRRCGFDLFGRPPTSPHCSECGAELERPKAIRAGRRESRRWPLVVGTLLFALTAGYWGNYAVQRVTHLGAADKPTWWLLRDADSKNAAYAQAAIGELVERHRQQKLTKSQRRKLMTLLLAIQAKPTATWDYRYGLAIERARAEGILTDEQWKDYWIHAWPWTLRVRQTVRRGDPVPTIIEGRNSISGGRHSGRFTSGGYSVAAMDIEGISCPPPKREEGWHESQFSTKGGGGGDGIAWVPPEVFAGLRDGNNKVKVWLDYVVRNPEADNRELIRTRFPLTAAFQLVSRDTKTVNFISPAQHRDVMLASFLSVKVKMPRGFDGETFVHQLRPRHGQLPVPVAAMVSLRKGSSEWPIGLYCSEADDMADFFKRGYHPAVAPGDKVDVILRPHPDAAALAVDITEAWGEEIIVPNVTVSE
ncbi:MAG: hypothetical protein ABSH20_17020 [Tepidisphaeraceae bacterium]